MYLLMDKAHWPFTEPNLPSRHGRKQGEITVRTEVVIALSGNMAIQGIKN